MWVPGLASWTSQETVSEIVSNWDHVKSGGVPGRVGGWDPSESKSSWSRSLFLPTLTPSAEPGLLFHLAVPPSAALWPGHQNGPGREQVGRHLFLPPGMGTRVLPRSPSQPLVLPILELDRLGPAYTPALSSCETAGMVMSPF